MNYSGSKLTVQQARLIEYHSYHELLWRLWQESKKSVRESICSTCETSTPPSEGDFRLCEFAETVAEESLHQQCFELAVQN